MNHEQFIASIEKTYRIGVALIKKKNPDYAKGDNPFSNFEFSNVVGVDVPHAILVRVCDKLARIENLLNKEPKVVEEKLEDTLLDCCNYLAILKAYLEDRRKS